MAQKKVSPRKLAEIRPVPQALTRDSDPASVRRKSWTISQSEGGQGSTDIEHRHMNVPLGDSDDDYGVRVHEMLHVKWSPLPSGEMDLAMLAAEDGRIESNATMLGMERPSPIPGGVSVPAKLWLEGKRPEALCCAVATTGSPAEVKDRASLAALGATEAIELMDWAASEYAADQTFNSALKVAARLREMFAAPPPERPEDGEPDDSKPEDGPSSGEPDDGDSDDSSSESDGMSGESKTLSLPAAKPAAPAPDKSVLGAHAPRPAKPADDSAEPVEEAPKSKIDPKAKADDLGGALPVDMDEIKKDMPTTRIAPRSWESRELDGASKWSDPRIQIPRRPIILVQEARGSKRSKATDYGTAPTRMHRAALDDRVFQSRKHKRQGTILVDMSGSMSISAEEIAELIKYAPAGVVAGYWGQSSTTSIAQGIIRILASGGRMVDYSDLRPTGLGNEIDGPALAWLARQRAPRVWVCDGVLTGAGDRGVNPELRAVCERIQAQARIKMVRRMDVEVIKKYLH